MFNKNYEGKHIIFLVGNHYKDGFDFGVWIFTCNIPYIKELKEDSQLPETVTMGRELKDKRVSDAACACVRARACVCVCV